MNQVNVNASCDFFPNVILKSGVSVISRTFLSIIGGAIAGILGLTGLTGFIFYFVVMAITSVALAAKARFSIHSYFDSWNRIIFDGFLGELMVRTLFPLLSCFFFSVYQ